VATAYRPPSSFGLLPPVVKNLLIINGLAFLAQIAFPGLLERWFALWPAGVPREVLDAYPSAASFYPWQLVTTAFLHGSPGHLFFNMLGLWMFGMRIEQTLGSARFAQYYFACVLGASLLQLLWTSAPFLFDIGTPSLGPTLGASGGVLGVLAAFGLLYPDEPIYLYFLFPVPAKWLVLGFAALDLYSGFTGSGGNTAHFAHLGGMITGAILIQYWRGRLPVRPRRREAA
jgi:membrane associated rhomboid family serine protease